MCWNKDRAVGVGLPHEAINHNPLVYLIEGQGFEGPVEANGNFPQRKRHTSRKMEFEWVSLVMQIVVFQALSLIHAFAIPKWIRSSEPFNMAYRNMQVIVYQCFVLTDLMLLLLLYTKSGDSLNFPLLFWHLYHLAMCAAMTAAYLTIKSNVLAQTWSMATLVQMLILLIGFVAGYFQEHDPSTYQAIWTQDVMFGAMYLVMGLLMILGPVLSSWDHPIEPFVRWFPLNRTEEYVWRHIFFVFAVFFIWSSFDPLRSYRPFVLYQSFQGILHSIMMAIDWQRNIGGNQKYPQKKYGDILGLMIIGVMSLLGILSSKAYPWVAN
jgi:hypothetical protein